MQFSTHSSTFVDDSFRGQKTYVGMLETYSFFSDTTSFLPIITLICKIGGKALIRAVARSYMDKLKRICYSLIW